MILNLEQQVVSLDLARTLKKVGVPQSSIFRWFWFSEQSYGVRLAPHCPISDSPEEIFSAYSAAELMDILPANVVLPGKEPFDNFRFSVNKMRSKNIQYIANYHCDTTDQIMLAPLRLLEHNICDEKLADCLAKTLLAVMDKIILGNETDAIAIYDSINEDYPLVAGSWDISFQNLDNGLVDIRRYELQKITRVSEINDPGYKIVGVKRWR